MSTSPQRSAPPPLDGERNAHLVRLCEGVAQRDQTIAQRDQTISEQQRILTESLYDPTPLGERCSRLGPNDFYIYIIYIGPAQGGGMSQAFQLNTQHVPRVGLSKSFWRPCPKCHPMAFLQMPRHAIYSPNRSAISSLCADVDRSDFGQDLNPFQVVLKANDEALVDRLCEKTRTGGCLRRHRQSRDE